MVSDPRIVRLRRRQRWRNRLQALLLLAGMVGTLAASTAVVFGWQGAVWVLLVGAGMLLMRPRMRPAWVLRMYRARPLPPSAAPDVHRLIAVLAERVGLPSPPRLYYVPSPMLNAFAVGDRDDAAIGVTDGLLRRLSGRQLAGVLAHEISHIGSDDLRTMTLADTVGRLTHAVAYAGLFGLLFGSLAMAGGGSSGMLVRIVVASAALMAVPTITTLLQLGLSRAREYDADLAAATLTGDPLGLASALRVLHDEEGRVWERIMVPHRGTVDQLLLRTHPTAEERIRRLEELAPGTQRTATPVSDDHPPAGFGPAGGGVRLRPPGIWR